MVGTEKPLIYLLGRSSAYPTPSLPIWEVRTVEAENTSNKTLGKTLLKQHLCQWSIGENHENRCSTYPILQLAQDWWTTVVSWMIHEATRGELPRGAIGQGAVFKHRPFDHTDDGCDFPLGWWLHPSGWSSTQRQKALWRWRQIFSPSNRLVWTHMWTSSCVWPFLRKSILAVT